ncbi:MFS transporter [Streptomyces sp. NPDC052042]|uniref:MFS transporter n=1 Tax=Streptomyces sp. NPDC052042 TaxID=3365683 RepID=UPI0037D16D28
MSSPTLRRPPTAGPSHRKVIVATGAGQVIEWFDWTLYATFAPYFAGQFFTEGAGGSDGLLAAFGIYAIGFFFRPLGGVLFGHLADRFGRSVIFNLTVLMMAAGSLLIAVLPAYHSIGIAAPLILLFARVVQGLSAGGEMPASTALIAEAAPARRRGLYSSAIFVGVGIGVLLASLLGWILTTFLTEEQVMDYGWRIAFGVGALVGLYALVLRRSLHVEEPAHITAEQTAAAAPPAKTGIVQGLVTLFKTQPRGVLRIIGFGIGGTVSFYTVTVYMPTYLKLEVGMASSTAFMVNCIALALYSLLPPLAGLLSDRFGRRPVMGFSSLALAIVLVPLASLLSNSVAVTLPILLVLVVLLTGFHGPFPALMSEQFSPESRGLGIGLAYSVATAAFGGTATYLATWLVDAGNAMWYFGYVALTALIAAVCYFTMPETSQGLDAPRT